MEDVICLDHVTKKFKVYFDKAPNLKDKVLFWKRNRHETRTVLDDVSFSIKKGQAVGLIGKNGCGKSTTLKLLTKIIYPSAGSVVVKGKVSALIELGAGFHPDMSGRENIYTNAAIFGLTRAEIDERLQTIIDFSELGEYIDNPVRTYSSGMYMRLAFSVAINVDAEILLVDEILAVGDMAFQAKCFNKLREIKRKGTTIVIVSHALPAIEQLCERSIWIDDGKIRMEGTPRDVHPVYMEYMAKKDLITEEKEPASEASAADDSREEEAKEAAEPVIEPAEEQKKRWGSGEARMAQVRVVDRDGTERYHFSPEEPFTIHIDYTAGEVLTDAVVGLAIYRSDQTYVYGTNTLIDSSAPVVLNQKGSIDLIIDCLPVTNGDYTIDLALHKPDGFNYDFWREICTLRIRDSRETPGVIHLPHRWGIS